MSKLPYTPPPSTTSHHTPTSHLPPQYSTAQHSTSQCATMMSHNDVEVAARTRDVSGRREVRKAVRDGMHSETMMYARSKTMPSLPSLR